MAALRHSAVTRVLVSSGYGLGSWVMGQVLGLQVGFSGYGLGSRVMGWVLGLWVGFSGYGLGSRVMGWVLGLWVGFSGYGLGSQVMSWVLGLWVGFSGYRSDSQVAVSGRRLQLMHCTYLLLWSRDFVHISGSQILGYSGQVVQEQDARM